MEFIYRVRRPDNSTVNRRTPVNPTLEQLVARDALAKGIPGCLHSREHQRRFARRAVETAAGCYTTGLMANANPGLPGGSTSARHRVHPQLRHNRQRGQGQVWRVGEHYGCLEYRAVLGRCRPDHHRK